MGRGEAMMTERVDPRRAQVAQVGVRKRSLKRPWFFLVIRCDKGGMHIRQSAPSTQPSVRPRGLSHVRPGEARAVKLSPSALVRPGEARAVKHYISSSSSSLFLCCFYCSATAASEASTACFSLCCTHCCSRWCSRRHSWSRSRSRRCSRCSRRRPTQTALRSCSVRTKS